MLRAQRAYAMPNERNAKTKESVECKPSDSSMEAKLPTQQDQGSRMHQHAQLAFRIWFPRTDARLQRLEHSSESSARASIELFSISIGNSDRSGRMVLTPPWLLSWQQAVVVLQWSLTIPEAVFRENHFPKRGKMSTYNRC